MKIPRFSEALVDCDLLRYRCGFATDYTIYKVVEDGLSFKSKKEMGKHLAGRTATVETENIVEPVENAISLVVGYLHKIENYFECPARLIISGKTNFRDEVATLKPYKGNRTQRKPAHYPDLTKWFIDNGAEVTDGIEADDLLAIYSAENSVICSVDKDLLQVPGWHHDFIKNTISYVDEFQGFFNLCVQILAGDSTDNIQGIPGIGVMKAEQRLTLLKTEKELITAVVEAYKKFYKEEWRKYLDENAALVYLLRYPGDTWNLDDFLV